MAVLIVAMLTIAQPLSACPVCFGSPGDPMVKGATNGVLLLLGVILFVQIGFVALFFTFWKKARSLRQRREQFRLLEGGAR